MCTIADKQWISDKLKRIEIAVSLRKHKLPKAIK